MWLKFSTLKLKHFGVSLAQSNMFKPSSKIYLLTVLMRYFFCGSVCVCVCVCVRVFHVCHAVLSAALWSAAGKGLTSWHFYVWCFLVFLSLSHMVSLVRCGYDLSIYLCLMCLFNYTSFLNGCTDKQKALKRDCIYNIDMGFRAFIYILQ